MALITYSNLEEVTYSTGIGNLVISGPGRGGQGLYSRCSNGDTFRYYISGVDSSGKPDGEWEQGLGTWRTGNIVERTSIDSSSNADAKVSFSEGPKYLKVLSSVNEGLSPTQIAAVAGLVSRAWNVLAYGAKCDGRVVNDATMTARGSAGNVTIGSATANFTAADVGKSAGITPNTPTVGYVITRGYIVSVESGTSATMYVPGAVSAILSAGSLILASDDSAAIAAALSAAAAGGGGEVVFPGMSAATVGFTVPDGVSLSGLGMGQRSALGWAAFATGLVYLGAYQASGVFVTANKRASYSRHMTIDAAAGWPMAYDQQGGGTGTALMACHIAGGWSTTLRVAGSSRTTACDINGRFRGTPLEQAGDSVVSNGNYIYGAGDALPLVLWNDPTDDCQLSGNHLYRGGWGITVPANPGMHLHVKAFGTVTAAGGVIAQNHFDTSEGHAIQIDVFNTSAGRAGVQALSIVGNQFYQPQPFTTDTYAAIRVNVGSGGANPALLRGLSVTGNVLKGSPGTAQGQASGSTKRWNALIDWNVQATHGACKAVSVVGNSATDTKQLYATSGAAYSPDYSAGNTVFDGTTTTVG